MLFSLYYIDGRAVKLLILSYVKARIKETHSYELQGVTRRPCVPSRMYQIM